jgi:general L-amino acid transport system permease protein
MSDNGKSFTKSLSTWFGDERVRGKLAQGLVVFLLLLLISFMLHNTSQNIEKRGIKTGFGFLANPAGYDIAFSIIDFNSSYTHGRIFFVGILNTLLISSIGIVLATFLGFFVGIMRLSNNWLIAKVSYVYIDIIRNIPLLVQLLLWYSFFLGLPKIQEAYKWLGLIFSNAGLNTSAPDIGAATGILPVDIGILPTSMGWSTFFVIVIAIFVGFFATKYIKGWGRRRMEETGNRPPMLPLTLITAIVLPLMFILFFTYPIGLDAPTVNNFGRLKGGTTIPAEFMVLLLGLTVYTSAFIAEIVRAGIMAVNKGQTEAANSLGLKRSWTLNLIVIPQALRVIIPPLTSQYLNLTKNSSLATAIAYPDLVATFGGTTLNQTGQAIECIALTMLVYLTISLSISIVMNIYNRSIALVER